MVKASQSKPLTTWATAQARRLHCTRLHPSASGHHPGHRCTGTTVTGNGEPGATVTVRGPDGSVLGSTVVGTGGAFEITLNTPQTNGQALTVEQRDPAGNLSAAVDLPAPDTQAPDIPPA